MNLVSLPVFLLSVVLLQVQLASVNGQSSVSLTVEGGGELVGDYCPDPGTVRLVCEGERLTFMRWRYNDENDIHQFDTDDSAATISPSETDHPAFISVTLNTIVPDPDDRSFADFTSTLTVDLGELDSVTDIVCGDTRTDSISVNVNLLQMTVPATPNINSITAYYQSTELTSVDVTWEKLIMCPQFEAFLYFEINIGPDTSQNISQTSCRESLCMAQFTDTTSGVELSLRAVNELGTSGTATYAIEQDSGQYFTPQVDICDNCEATAQCVLSSGISESVTCSVQYTSDMDLSDLVTAPLNMAQQLQPNIVYFFVFSVMVDERLTVNVTLEDSCSTSGGLTNVPVNIPASVTVPVVIVILIIAVTSVVIVFLCVYRKVCFKHRLTQENRLAGGTDEIVLLTSAQNRPVEHDRLQELLREAIASMQKEQDAKLEEAKKENEQVKRDLQVKKDELNAKEEELKLKQQKHQQEMAEFEREQDMARQVKQGELNEQLALTTQMEMARQIKERDEKIKKLEQALNQKDKQLKEKDLKIKDLEASNQALKEQVDNLTTRNEELETIIRDLQQQINALNQNLVINHEAIKQDMGQCVKKDELEDLLKTTFAEIMSQNNTGQLSVSKATSAAGTATKLQTDYKCLSSKPGSKSPDSQVSSNSPQEMAIYNNN